LDFKYLIAIPNILKSGYKYTKTLLSKSGKYWDLPTK